ncbi:MAG: hypothetical protein ABJA35_02805 [Parafilimonas sp.]
MNIDAEISNYLSRFSDGEKNLLLNILKKFDSADNENSLAEKIVTYNNELEEAVQKIKSGEYFEHADVLNKANEW